MNACYGFVYPESRTGSKCARCGANYYAHSHLEYQPNGETRLRRYPIRLNLHPGDPCGVEARKGMPDGYRTVYDRMMDRQPGVCDWYKLQAAKAVEEQADKIVDYANNPITAAVTEAMAAARIYRLPSPDLLVQRFGPFTPDNRTRP